MTEAWKQWEGRTVDSKFVLGTCLGGSNAHGVFRTHAGEPPADAVIKLIAADAAPETASRPDARLLHWERVRELRHPNLIRILAAGKWAADEHSFVYAVEELADENLGQIVPERALTAEEARGVLEAVLAALEYVHGAGPVHGRIRPANILAAGDQIKLSSDSLQPPGETLQEVSIYDAPEIGASGVSTAGDVWSLGMTLVEVLTQHVPAWDAARLNAPAVSEDVPEPFRSIARRCLEIDPQKRCRLGEIRQRLEGRMPAGAVTDRASRAAVVARAEEVASPSAAEKSSAKWVYGLLAVAVIGVAAFVILRPHSSGNEERSAAQSSTVQPAPVEAPPQTSPSTSEPPAPQKAASAESEKSSAKTTPSKDEITDRVMPEISPGARRTISGTIKVRVKVHVDADGNVSSATLKTAGPSQYFAHAAMEAARRWKFAPAPKDETRAWTLVFAFRHSRTEASAQRSRD